MKQIIQIFKNEKMIYNGRIAEIPIKNEYIIKKSVELFDDEDPCIIHQSYVIKEYVDVLLGEFRRSNNVILGKDNLDLISFLDFTELDLIVIKLKGWVRWESI